MSTLNSSDGHRTRWVLAGAGNAHLKVLMKWAMSPIRGVEIFLVNRTSSVTYSAMLPRYIAGECRLEDIQVDLNALCGGAGATFILGEMEALEKEGQRLRISNRGPIFYDYLSLSLGSVAAGYPKLASFPEILAIRPLEQFVHRIDTILGRGGRLGLRVAIIGGGASGCEVALALHRRFGGQGDFSLTLFHAEKRILSSYPGTIRGRFENAFRRRSIELVCGQRVVGAEGNKLLLSRGDPREFDVVILTSEGAAPPLVSKLGLPIDSAGFLTVDDNLRVCGQQNIFAAGDCIALTSHPHLPRNGVYAVRQGEALYRNIRAIAHGKLLAPFRPQMKYLSLLNMSDGTAALARGTRSAHGPWVRRMKYSIDQAWIKRLQRLSVMGGTPGMEIRCGGCGSKVPSVVLSRVLERLSVPANPRVLVGCRDGEDACVQQPPAGQVEVQSVDFFKSFVDDPFLFGRLAAVHAVSDLHAMNARPFSALAICTVPPGLAHDQETRLAAMLEGALIVFSQIGLTLTGGHTTESVDLALGFSVTGYAHREKLFSKRALRPGDKLILTKPLGSGALLAALMREWGRSEWFEKLFQQMLLTASAASQLFEEAGVRACTDITGFGLAGHLREMIVGTELGLQLETDRVPTYEGFEEAIQHGFLSTLHPANEQASGGMLGAQPNWLYDPQTCGGLIAGVAPERADKLLGKLKSAGYSRAAIVGEVLPKPPTETQIIKLM